MSEQGCPHGPIIDGKECMECALEKKANDQITWASAQQLENLARKISAEKAATCPSCAAKDARMASLESDCRIIAGALGEFYGVGDGPKLTEKIASLRAEKAEAGLSALRAENEKLRKAVERAKDVEWMAKALGKQVAEDLSVFFHVTQQISETQFHQVVGNIVADAIINYLTKRGE